MTDPTELLTLIRDHGIIILAALAVLEGPIVTVIAAWLASMNILSLTQVFACVVLADLVGDTALYLAGRFAPDWLPISWARALGLSRRRVARFLRSFREKGPRLLVIGKLTHAAGFAMLIAAGAARMPFGQFLMINLMATIPKCLFFMAVGYLAGSAFASVGQWLFIFSVVVIGIIALIGLARWRQMKAAGS